MEAIRQGFDEAIMLNTGGFVAECTGDNIFLIRDGRLTTPPSCAGILEGVTRNVVIEIAAEMGLKPQEELFTLAQDTEDPLQRLSYYGELIVSYPDGEHADEAQFMIGFIQSEEIGNHEAARNAFQRLLEEYPESELVDSANWMIENMGKETPPFEDSDIVSPD